jgi:tetratricopeptide (TPR) repeat protein
LASAELNFTYYRLGRLQEAVKCFEESVKESPHFAAWDLFFLSMSYQRLNETAKARACYTRAVHGCEKQKDLPPEQVQELAAFQAEAEALFGQLGP